MGLFKVSIHGSESMVGREIVEVRFGVNKCFSEVPVQLHTNLLKVKWRVERQCYSRLEDHLSLRLDLCSRYQLWY